jgi:mono/diheme cytochrome c family protein
MKPVLALAAAIVIAVAIHLALRAPAPTIIRQTPAPPLEDAVKRGRLVYETYGCAMCHGAEGKGGFANTNAESEGKVPGLVMVKEGYLERELVQKILDGVSRIGKADAKGPVPPYRMPGWRDRMTRADATDLAKYLISLYPKKADADRWR